MKHTSFIWPLRRMKPNGQAAILVELVPISSMTDPTALTQTFVMYGIRLVAPHTGEHFPIGTSICASTGIWMTSPTVLPVGVCWTYLKFVGITSVVNTVSCQSNVAMRVGHRLQYAVDNYIVEVDVALPPVRVAARA